MQPYGFRVLHTSQECQGRVGELQTAHGLVQTPVFMPVGTCGSVKTLTPQDLVDVGVSIILGNTYHLHLRPGTEILDKFGGLHRFMHWQRPILTDSGGFQVFSLEGLNKISDDGVWFQSHLDGSRHWLSPEVSMAIQRSIGADIMMAFDQCCPYPAPPEQVQQAMQRSLAWAVRCRTDHPAGRNNQALFGIVQGGMDTALRMESLEKTAAIGFDGLAVGGLSVGEPKEIMQQVLADLMPHFPAELPRYLMGVGTPEDLFLGIEHGIDMFDCVHPTRIARHGAVFTPHGRVRLVAAVWRDDDEPIDATCSCYACRTFSRGYLRHLFKAGEILALRMASLHNVAFMITLIEKIRKVLLDGTFRTFRQDFFADYFQAT